VARSSGKLDHAPKLRFDLDQCLWALLRHGLHPSLPGQVRSGGPALHQLSHGHFTAGDPLAILGAVAIGAMAALWFEMPKALGLLRRLA
jgi:hypothetical protein